MFADKILHRGTVISPVGDLDDRDNSFGAGIQHLTVDGRSPKQQIEECTAVTRAMHLKKRGVYLKLVGELAAEGITIAAYDDLPDDDRETRRATASRSPW